MTRNPGTEISKEILGLSYETAVLLPDDQGVRYFRPDNRPLVDLFRTLGVRSLRVGGNSVDAARIPVPSEADVHSLFQFAQVAGVKVIYSVRLENGDPQSAASVARVIRDNYADTLDLFAIGNEPTGYYKDTKVLLARWASLRDAILAEWPEARFCGPDENPKPELCKTMVASFGAPAGRLVQITQHSYPFGCSYRNPGEKDVSKLVPVDVAAARERMLAPDAYTTYDNILEGIKESVGGTPISYRLSETNSYWFSGLEGASDRYASALWGLDYLHWWAARGVAGVNFHTGDQTGGVIVLPCRYAAFVTSTNGYEVRPLGYGMKLFSLGGHGRVLPVEVVAGASQNVAAYASLAGTQTLYVTVVNRAHGPDAADVTVRIQLDAPLSRGGAAAIFLTAKSSDIAARSEDVTLGGATILEDGSWAGQWSALPDAVSRDAVAVTMSPASAVVIKLDLQ